MSGTALDHRLVRDYLRDLDKAMRGLPATQARELKEQITAHLDDALQPAASDHEVAATLSRLGSPDDLAAEAATASGSAGAPLTLSRRWVRWRLAALIAVPTVIAAVFGTLQISGDVSSYAASGRALHLARLDAAVVNLIQKLEDERDLSAYYTARKANGPLTQVRAATDVAASAVRADAAGVGAGYSPGAVQDLDALLAGITVLGDVRSTVPAPGAIGPLYTRDVIQPAITFSAAAGDARLPDTVITLASLLGVEDALLVQRAIVHAALSARPPVLAPADLTSLQQTLRWANKQTQSASMGKDALAQPMFSFMDNANAAYIEAEQQQIAEAAAYMGKAIGSTHGVAGELAGQVTARAAALRSDATRRLVLASIVTAGLLLIMLLITAAVGRSLTRPPRR